MMLATMRELDLFSISFGESIWFLYQTVNLFVAFQCQSFWNFSIFKSWLWTASRKYWISIWNSFAIKSTDIVRRNVWTYLIHIGIMSGTIRYNIGSDTGCWNIYGCKTSRFKQQFRIHCWFFAIFSRWNFLPQIDWVKFLVSSKCFENRSLQCWL